MNNRIGLGLIALLAFGSALGGLFIGRAWILPQKPVESEIHVLLHHELKLDAQQEAQIEKFERAFAPRKQALELELRSDNARLAAAIEAEHGYGPQVQAAVDRSHTAMGELQKITLEHIFAMRGVLRPNQAARFDEAVTRALTARER
ncbi:periplasmic heavy metal sensor [Sphingopyxis sp. GW247-27LB]|uniref:periplasmic heavy metal sensor n=1 Tax=Sphingopyxis sp. GW247-27LB TaxID=2012632 RepID=UPI000BA66402|nr:periplasmic heavy metal sensor [Sphingopyxis sp. GW247-27LB]PAL19778.1 heavy metal resistance protein [Sphingopyxis sp. GW247-27LB]